MRRYSKTAIAISVVAAAATVLAGCTSSKSKGPSGTSSASGTPGATAAAYNAAFSSVVNPSTKTGGTLQLGSTSDCDSWDPKIAYYGWCWNMQRLYVRSLIGYSSVNGTSFKLAPD